MKRLLFLLALVSLVPANAYAQRAVIYDTVAMGTPAAVTCGFCFEERYGVVFRELTGPRPGLRASEFPLTLNSIQLAMASATVDELQTCSGSSAGGTISVRVRAFAGVTPPSGSIRANPADGAWTGETEVFNQSADVMLSRAMTEGGSDYDVMINTLMLDPAARIDPPNTYIRVVVDIPAGTSSGYCSLIGDLLGRDVNSGAFAIRDDSGRIATGTGFIYAMDSGGLGIDQGWYWNEEVPDSSGGGNGIDGNWVIRLNVTPITSTGTDAGVDVDAGMTGTDAGMTSMDSGAGTDAGMTAMCSADVDCAGGERCVEGTCRRVSCTAASDCSGGMTCFEGMCRNLCTSNAECLGGEVCDTAAGHCVPVTEDGGCGCRAVGSDRRGSIAWLLLSAIAGVIVVRRARRR